MPLLQPISRTYISNGVEQFSHGLAAFEFSFLHCLQFHKHGINFGHDTADRMFHAIHTATQANGRKTTAISLNLFSIRDNLHGEIFCEWGVFFSTQRNTEDSQWY